MASGKTFAFLTITAVLLLSSMACVTFTAPLHRALNPAPMMPANEGDLLPPDAAQDPEAVSPDQDEDRSDHGSGEHGEDPTGFPPGEQPSPDNRTDAYDAEERPLLSGPAETFDTYHFRIHYTFEGADAIPSLEYVQEIAGAFEYVWEMEIDYYGWAAPPPDGQIGGSSHYDVYLKDTLWDGMYGYVESSMEPHGSTDGDNPNTLPVETRATPSFIVLDNDFADMEDLDMEAYPAMEMMRSTAAHEFNHALQFGYDSEEPAEWLWEATATWMQDEVFDDVNDGVEDLYSVAKSPDTCQPAVGGTERVEDDNHWYGEWIFLRYLSEKYGHEIVRSIWEQAAFLNGYSAIEAALQNVGTSLEAVMEDFSIALLLRSFEEGDTFPAVRLEGQAWPGDTFTPVDGVGQMGADYVEIPADGMVTVTLESNGLVPIMVGIQGDQAIIFRSSENQISADADEFDQLYLMIVNTELAHNEYHCEFSSYTLDVRSGGQPQQPAAVLPASNFHAPEVEGLMDPDEIWGEGWEEAYSEYESVQPPPELIPDYLPEGYELYDAYIMTADDLGENSIWYTPGGTDLIVVDFYGPGEEDYLSTSSSDNPYKSFTEFFDDADWEPYDDEWRTLHGVDVIIEDYSDDEGPYSFATCILGEQFIVAEGNLTPAEMEKVVESMLD